MTTKPQQLIPFLLSFYCRTKTEDTNISYHYGKGLYPFQSPVSRHPSLTFLLFTLVLKKNRYTLNSRKTL